MIRKVTVSLNQANAGKLHTLSCLLDEYVKVQNRFINHFWENQDAPNLAPKEVTDQIDTWMSARVKQACAKQAGEAVRSQRKKKSKTKPTVKARTANLDSRFVSVNFDQNSFDVWVRLSSLGNRIRLNLPSRKHRMFEQFEGWNLRKGARLRQTSKGFFLDLYFEQDSPPPRAGLTLGVDQGYRKLATTSEGDHYGANLPEMISKIDRKVRGSKAHKRALIERDELVNRAVKGLLQNDVSRIVLEDLRGIKTRSKLGRDMNRKLSYWTYARFVSRLKDRCEVVGVQLSHVDPRYTSQTCSACGVVDKGSRKGETFACRSCGCVFDADHNAAVNILRRGLQHDMVAVGSNLVEYPST